MSNTQKTRTSKSRKPINRMATRRGKQAQDLNQTNGYDDEYYALLAAMEWSELSKEQKQAVESLAIYDLPTYADVRVGMKHRSADEFVEWGIRFGLGVASTQNDLNALVAAEWEALRHGARLLTAKTGSDVVLEHIALTRTIKVSSNIRKYKLPSGAHFHFSPYDLGTPERTVWMIRCAKRLHRA